MINGKDIRIGNCIWDDTKHHVKFVNHRVINDLASHPAPLPYSPIYITKELLENNCGFTQKGSQFFHRSGFYINMVIVETDDKGGYTTGYIIPLSRFMSSPFYYLHDLQNVYRVVAGKELEIVKSNHLWLVAE